MRILSVILLLVASISAAQESPNVFVEKLVGEISQLSSTDLIQKAQMSKADPCVISVIFKYLDEEPPGKEVMHLKLSDLDETDPDLLYSESLEEWDLLFYCDDFEDRVFVIDEEEGNYFEGVLMVSDSNQAVLQQLKATFQRAIIGCKQVED